MQKYTRKAMIKKEFAKFGVCAFEGKKEIITPLLDYRRSNETATNIQRIATPCQTTTG